MSGNRAWVRVLSGVMSLMCGVVWGCKWGTKPVGEREQVVVIPPPGGQDTFVAHAVAVARTAQEHLSGVLVRELRHRGQVGAIRVCNEKAKPLLEEVRGKFPEVTKVRRVSHRSRNPANRANEQELAILRAFMEVLKEGREPPPQVVQVGDTLRVYVPIVLSNPLCLTCHGVVGRDIPDSVYSVIRNLYPGDSAVGFRLGELRGAWLIELRWES